MIRQLLKHHLSEEKECSPKEVQETPCLLKLMSEANRSTNKHTLLQGALSEFSSFSIQLMDVQLNLQQQTP